MAGTRGYIKYVRVIFVVALLFINNADNIIFARSKVISTTGWTIFRSTHFLFYARPGIPKRFLYKMKRYAEKYYRQIVQDLGLLRSNYWIWEERCRVYIYANKKDFLANSGMPEWSDGSAVLQRREIHLYYMTGEKERLLFISTLPHEMTHLIFYEARKGQSIPNCIDEGVAMREEGDQRRIYSSQYIVAKALVNNKYIPLERLFDWRTQYLKMDKETALLFYAESCLFIDFLLSEFPRSFFSTFCWRMRVGNDFLKAFRLSYARYNAYNKIDIMKLNKEFLGYIMETNPFLQGQYRAQLREDR